MVTMDDQDMRKFILAASEYSRHNADASASEVQKHLQMIASTTNTSLFDPSSPVASQFYMSLHELMSAVDSRSMLVWPAITALQKACTNTKAKETLIHTYKFIPVLTRFLSTNHMSDKQLRLLQVLSEVTYGVKITWQEAHLSHLVTTLVQIVMGNNKEHQAQALTVLVNLCYRNLPVLYVLMRKIEITKFIKCVTKMNDTPAVGVQVCKMLVILGELKGPLPDADLLSSVDVLFKAVTDAFQRRDPSTLKQTVDFFTDIISNPVISRYSKWYEDTKRLVDLMASPGGPDEGSEDCIATLLDFFSPAFKIKPSKTVKLIPRLLNSIMPWISRDKTFLPSINILLMANELIASQAPDSMESESSEMPELPKALSLVINLLRSEGALLHCKEREEQLIGIATLLTEMSATCPDLRNQILETVDCDLVKSIFEHLYKQTCFYQSTLRRGSGSHLSVQLVFLVSTLSTFRDDWMTLYMELLSKRQVLTSMAVALLDGDKSVKCQVFRLVGAARWGKESLASLCELMSELRPDAPESLPKQHTLSAVDCMPLYVSESRIDELLDSLQGVAVGEAATSAVMELYEYKLAAMGHAERRVQAALEAADAQCIGLNHQVAHMRGEAGRLHQMLLYGQQTLEGVTAEKKDLMRQLELISSQSAQEKSSSTRKLNELTARVQGLERALKKQEREVELKDGLLEQEASKVKDLESALQVSKAECQDLKAENEELRKTLAQCVERSSQKDEQLADCGKKIQYLEQIREAVISVAARKDIS